MTYKAATPPYAPLGMGHLDALRSEASVKLFPGQYLCYAIDLGCIGNAEHRQQRFMPLLASAIEADFPCTLDSRRRPISGSPHLGNVIRSFSQSSMDWYSRVTTPAPAAQATRITIHAGAA